MKTPVHKDKEILQKRQENKRLETQSIVGAGGKKGGAAGTIKPGLGNLVGAVVGGVIGAGLFAFSDLEIFGGQSARQHIRNGWNNRPNWMRPSTWFN